MFRLLKGRLATQKGSATIEAMGAMVVFIAALILASYMGVTFYNASILNSAAQNITLNTQVQLDRWCAPNQPAECNTGRIAAESIRNVIVNETQGELVCTSLDVNRGTGCTIGFNAQALPPGSSGTWPTGYPSLGTGWGYNTIRLTTTQDLFGNPDLPGQVLNPLQIRANSMTLSYKDPSL